MGYLVGARVVSSESHYWLLLPFRVHDLRAQFTLVRNDSVVGKLVYCHIVMPFKLCFGNVDKFGYNEDRGWVYIS